MVCGRRRQRQWLIICNPACPANEMNQGDFINGPREHNSHFDRVGWNGVLVAPLASPHALLC